MGDVLKSSIITREDAFVSISKSIESILEENGIRLSDCNVHSNKGKEWVIEFHNCDYGNEIPIGLLMSISDIVNLPLKHFRVHRWNYNESSWRSRLDVVYGL